MEKREKVLRLIDQKQDEIIEFLRSLIQSRPVNPVFDSNNVYGERECQKLIKDRLAGLGMKIKEHEVSLDELEEFRGLPGYNPGFTDKISFKDRPNVLACLPGSDPENSKSLILTGHCDVVAAANADKWKFNPFEAVVRDGVLHGRGVVDMLGGLASMIMAIEAIVQSGVQLRGDLWLGSIIGEETGGTGFLAVADYFRKNGIKFDAGIMGEPTDLDLSLLCRGIIWGELVIRGRAGHLEVATEHWTEGGAVDAIQKARHIMNAIDELNRDWSTRADKNHPLMKESCEVKIALIDAGHHLSSYADYCKLSYNIQVLPHDCDENGLGINAKREFEEFIKNIANTDPWLRENPPEIKWILEADCAEVPQDDLFVQTFSKVARSIRPEMQTTGSGFHTDMGWMTRLVEMPIFNFGPGNPSLAHLTNEQCKIEDIITATKIMALACMEWCE